MKQNSKNEAEFDERIEELLNIKAQLDIVPTELIIEAKTENKYYEFNGYRFTRCKDCIIYHQSGYDIVVKSWIQSLYGTLEYMLDLYDSKDKWKTDDKDMFETLLAAVTLFFSFPSIAFTDDNFMIDSYKFLMQRMTQLVQEKLNQPLGEEDEQFLDAMRNMVKGGSND